jgi:HlyD family secretion protein
MSESLFKASFFIVFVIGLVACKQREDKSFCGYMEGDFVMIAPSTNGILKTLSVKRGQTVEIGADLFSLDLTNLVAVRNAARANLAKAQAQLEDLKKGARAEEIEVILQQKQQAEAVLLFTKKEYERIGKLFKNSAVSEETLEQTKSAYDEATGRVKELEASIIASSLGGRIDQVAEAQADIDAALQAVAQAEKLLAEAEPKAPAPGAIDDVFFRPGEFVAAGQPVVSILPAENVKARFFVPQAILPKLQPGQAVTITCDGCEKPVAARISYISNQAEYTPPVIYSVESRDKLVFMIEATPDTPDMRLRPGLPVDISLKTENGKL